MQALLAAPALLGGGAAAAGTAAAASTLPVWATVAKAAAPILSGVAGYSQAQGQKQLAENNAYIGRTQAMQTNVAARQNLNSELGTLRATFAANGQQPGVGTDAIFQELRKVRSRERRIEFNNNMQAASGFALQAQNASSAGAGALLGGLTAAGPSLFDLYQLKTR